MARRQDKNTTQKFNKISIGLASPESVLGASRGEVLKPETINYRTHKFSRKPTCVPVYWRRLSKQETSYTV